MSNSNRPNDEFAEDEILLAESRRPVAAEYEVGYAQQEVELRELEQSKTRITADFDIGYAQQEVEFAQHDAEATFEQPQGWKLRRFFQRALVATLFPFLLTGYYMFLWWVDLRKQPDPVKYATGGATWRFYIWFLSGIVGLGISKYGLLGVEASMLHEPFWQVRDGMAIMMQHGASWSGPSGWTTCIKRLVLRKRLITHRLWFLLAFPSIMLFVALPLSGLCMELSDGFIKSSDHPLVIGRTWRDFNQRQFGEALERAGAFWKFSSPPKVPGIGIVYTPPTVDRSELSFLSKRLPNSLPLDGGANELFLAPQASTPIDGTAWGLLFNYNCSIIDKASDFTILGKNSSSIHMFNSSSGRSVNIWGYAELAVDKVIFNQDGVDEAGYDERNLTILAPNGRLNTNIMNILELAVWQVRSPGAYEDSAARNFNYTFTNTIDHPIPDLGQLFIQTANGTYITNTSQPGFQQNYAQPDIPYGILELAPAIGVRCLHTSSVGTARLHGRTSTFTDFSSTSTPFLQSQTESRTARFGETAAAILRDKFFEFFSSTDAEPPLTLSNGVLYTHFLQSSTLLKSASLAYAADALELMYDCVYSFDGNYSNPNATSSSAGKVLTRGVVHPLAPVAFLLLWTLCSTVLGVTYGFRRRWSDTLNGYSLFRFGADFAAEIKSKPGFSGTRDFPECEELHRLPGLVGDARVREAVGHITLVARANAARKDKLYF